MTEEEEKKINLERIEGSEYCSAKWTAKKLTYIDLEKVLNGDSLKEKDKAEDIKEVKLLMKEYPKQIQFSGLLTEIAKARFEGIDLDKPVELVINGMKLTLKSDAKETKQT